MSFQRFERTHLDKSKVLDFVVSVNRLLPWGSRAPKTYLRCSYGSPFSSRKKLRPDISCGTLSDAASSSVGATSSPDTSSFVSDPGLTTPGQRINIGTCRPG